MPPRAVSSVCSGGQSESGLELYHCVLSLARTLFRSMHSFPDKEILKDIERQEQKVIHLRRAGPSQRPDAMERVVSTTTTAVRFLQPVTFSYLFPPSDISPI